MASKNPDRLPLLHGGLLLPAVLAVVAWMAGAYMIERQIVTPRSAEQIAAAAEQRAQQYAAQLQQLLDRRAGKLQQLGGAYTSAALGEPASLPEGARIQRFDAGEIRVGAGGEPPLNFALMDLLKRSLEETPQPLEILRTGADNGWQLHNAVGLEGGALLVTQPLDAFAAELQTLHTGGGQLALQQKFTDGPTQTLWRAGQGGGNAVRVPVEDSYLTLVFTPDAAFAREHGIAGRWCYIGGGVGLLVTLLLLLRFVPRDTPAPWERNSRPRVDDRQELEQKPAEISSSMQGHTPPTAPRDGGDPSAAEKSAAEQQTEKAPAKPAAATATDFPRHVFRAYDIRGIAGREINEPFAYQLGLALGSLAQHAGENVLLVGRDGRNSSELLADCLIEGIRDSGCNSVNLGLVPSPLVYFACARGRNTSSGIVVTASHNPAEYNGFKIVMKGRPLAEDKLRRLHQLMQKGPFKRGEGSNREQDIRETYIDAIFNDVALAGQPHLVVDAGNGATSLLAPRLFEQLGCAVTPLFCEVDGNFPNHPPDPSRPENLQALIDKVKETRADLGVALDGDGDRVTLISSSGRIAWADQLVMLLARDILARNPGEDIVFDVKSSRALAQLVNQYGGRPVMWKTGHAPMKTKMLETGAILGGELSGHIFIKDRWFGFDDGIYAAARILEIMALREQSLDELLDSLPQLVSTPEILIEVDEREKFAVIEQLKQLGDFGKADISTVDGLRIEYADGWGLVRASNTGAALTLRFEAETEEALERIRRQIMAQLKKVDPKLAVPDWKLV